MSFENAHSKPQTDALDDTKVGHKPSALRPAPRRRYGRKRRSSLRFLMRRPLMVAALAALILALFALSPAHNMQLAVATFAQIADPDEISIGTGVGSPAKPFIPHRP